ncbi:RagB/SusD family nutrient uptake outer membrane protein [Lacinutrix sp. C3R15]|uniref:RagB/SusD family nutrient uptake outer membrane protein n=1 Tax=Flavobacteriaceae TaxID=49546 RepID=UPI001C088834|nr:MULTISPECIES: RagB/SusD family nutrient uptake outer membrane protein [Flavobacteriaceae]MBU2939184.1 RagB/SusD family nutrient uptake outer membrane protein [Lacinutrix sp. C3R15]MDO6622500.1 RagB/SusD family nutrient uptake outer membrane protein [Oceanihabitans sp. 1_MG-2023]
MKTKYIILSILTGVLFITTSCEEFLEEDPKGLVTPDTFFQNEDEANLALNGLQNGIDHPEIQGHIGTDVGVAGRVPIAAGWLPSVYDTSVDAAPVLTRWSNAYTNIRNANLVLAGLEKSSLSDEVKGRAIAQALFYRANKYLFLVYTYGDVPYWRDELIIEEVSLLGKTDGEVIISEMIEDLDTAIASGYLPTSRWDQNEGRPTVWAVRMLKAYCHIWLKQWQEARTELIEITTNSPHGPDLGPYADMYREGNELHPEIIFGRQYLIGADNNTYHNQFHYNSNSENGPTRQAMTETGVFSRAASITLRKSFADTYDDNDVRKLYNVWDSHVLEDGSTATFNWIYIPKMMRANIPVSDPLMQNADPNNQSSQPIRLFVLSDAYLLLAEAEFMIGGSSTAALAAINKVRERANLPDLTTLTIQDIRNERAWELTAEGYWGRKVDLIRWGILESTVQALPAAETAAGAYSVAISYVQDEADNISSGPVGKFQVWPIPLNEILKSQDIGGALTQNPLWD